MGVRFLLKIWKRLRSFWRSICSSHISRHIHIYTHACIHMYVLMYIHTNKNLLFIVLGILCTQAHKHTHQLFKLKRELPRWRENKRILDCCGGRRLYLHLLGWFKGKFISHNIACSCCCYYNCIKVVCVMLLCPSNEQSGRIAGLAHWRVRTILCSAGSSSNNTSSQEYGRSSGWTIVAYIFTK